MRKLLSMLPCHEPCDSPSSWLVQLASGLADRSWLRCFGMFGTAAPNASVTRPAMAALPLWPPPRGNFGVKVWGRLTFCVQCYFRMIVIAIPYNSRRGAVSRCASLKQFALFSQEPGPSQIQADCSQRISMIRTAYIIISRWNFGRFATSSSWLAS